MNTTNAYLLSSAGLMLFLLFGLGVAWKMLMDPVSEKATSNAAGVAFGTLVLVCVAGAILMHLNLLPRLLL